jgi:hypothetical protein
MSNARKNEDAIGHGVRRLCIALDLERYSSRPDYAQREAQSAMAAILREASDRGALERAHWLTQGQGDGELALLPPGIDEAHVITSLIRQLKDGIYRHNRSASTIARLRMRVAAHEGVTYIAENGFAGDAINTVCRLRDAPVLKDALSRSPGTDVALIVSQRIYHDVICGHDAFDLRPGHFRAVDASLPDKDFHARAWIHVTSAEPGGGTGGEPGGTGGTGEPPAQEPTPAPAPAPAAAEARRDRADADEADRTGGVSISFGDNTRVRDVAGRDINKYHGPGWGGR